MRWTARGVVGRIGGTMAVVLAAVALGGCAAAEEEGAQGSGGGSGSGQQSGNRATDDYTPRMPVGGSVIVDTLTWRVAGARRAVALGESFARETADGVYVVVDLSVRNGKDESVTLTGDMITLEAAGKEYSTDSSGTIAAITGSEELFFLKDLGPDVTTRGVAVFDVPPALVGQRPEVCFGELGFGPGKGCIRLPGI